MDILSEEATLSKLFSRPFQKGVSSKRREFLPLRAFFFPLRGDTFSESAGEHVCLC